MIRNLRSLVTYAQVVESGSFSAAARALGLTLPMVSRDIAQIEKELGAVLIQRTTRRLSVTDEGRAFYTRACRVIDELSAAADELRPADGVIRGTVRLLLPTITVPHGLAESLATLMAAHPELRLQITITDAPPNLVGGGFDMGLYFGFPADSGHVVKYLTRASAPMAASPNYIRRMGLVHHPRELRDHECLRFISDQPQSNWRLTGPDGSQSDWMVSGRLEMDHSSGLASAMRAGLGIGVTTPVVLAEAERQGELVRVLPDWTWSELPVYALMPSGRQRLPRVRVVLAWLQAYAVATFG
jgi:DNA-binding transcriptional LysR family regulator